MIHLEMLDARRLMAAGAVDASFGTNGVAALPAGYRTVAVAAAGPTVYVIDAKGMIRFINVRNKKLEEAVESLLAEL